MGPRVTGMARVKAVAGASCVPLVVSDKVFGGGRSLARTRLRWVFPISGKFTGKNRKIAAQILAPVLRYASAGVACSPVGEFRA